MESLVLCVVIMSVVNVNAWQTEYTATGQKEGEECHRQTDEVWRCKKSSECEGLQDILKQKKRLKTCSWQGQTPILCCPPEKSSERIYISKSEEKCVEFAKLLCADQGVFITQYQTLASLQRRRRQDSYQQVEETTQYDPPPPFNVFGGKLTLSGQFPSVVNIEEPVVHTAVAGGKISRPKDNPHMALIGYGDPGAISWQCGGSLISETYVLSAAHCVNTPYGLARWVRLGDLDLRSDTEESRPQELEIVERVVNPGYRAPAYYNDLALFRLARPVVFDRFVRPACLHNDTRDPAGVGTAAGWGKNETHGPRSSALMQVDISFVPAEDCKRIVGVVDKYLPNGIDTDTMVCAGELGKDTCQGDSGGPLILPSTQWSTLKCLAKLVGVTSFGPKNCGMTSVPGAYVRVAHFLPWIESIVWPG